MRLEREVFERFNKVPKKERKGKERKGKDRKGKERKGKGRKEERRGDISKLRNMGQTNLLPSSQFYRI